MNAPALPETIARGFGLQGEVAPGIGWLRLPLPFKPEDHINVWLIEDAKGITLVDTGLADEHNRALWQAALVEMAAIGQAPTHHEKSALAGRPIHRIFITHHHPDHIGLAAWLADTYGATVHMPAIEAKLAERLLHAENDAELARHYAAHGMPCEANFVELRRQFYRQHVHSLPTQIVAVEDKARFEIGGVEWEVHLAGGHTPAHMLLFCPARKVLIAGDHILPEIVTNIGALSFDPEETPVADYLASLDRLAALPADTLVLPAHGLPFTGLAARCRRLREIHQERLLGVWRAAANDTTVWAMLPHIYGREMSGLVALLGFNQTKAYLDYLVTQGGVVATADASGIMRYRQNEAFA